MKILYIIPARGGSKGLPGKNIRLLNNRPLIAYSIDAAKSASHKGTVMVTTDDPEIAEVSKNRVLKCRLSGQRIYQTIQPLLSMSLFMQLIFTKK